MKRYFVLGLGLAAALCALAAPALAAARDDVLYGISRCGGIADDRTWLDCVYGAAQPMRAQLGLPPASIAQQKLVPPAIVGAPPPPARAFGAPQAPQAAAPAPRPGFFARMLTPSHEAPEPPTRMTSYKFDASGHFTAALANGEIWEQEIGDSAMARWNKPAGTYTVQIEPSSSTYHLMKVGAQEFMVDRN
jgi:hypothetical protein